MLLIFDCDGVLVDSELISCRVDAELLTSLGFPYTPDDIAKDFVGTSLRDQIRAVEAAHGCSLPQNFGEQLNALLFKRFETELQPIPGVRDAILTLPHPRCVASSSLPHRIDLTLRVTGLADLFQHRFSSSQVAHGKPAPDLFLFAAEQMGCEPGECVVIEDSLFGVQAACAAGMRVIGFCGGGHCQPGHADMLREAGADVVVMEMSELGLALGEIVAVSPDPVRGPPSPARGEG
jgi:HAD superfamily hydrolase (TIGR01509 family)